MCDTCADCRFCQEGYCQIKEKQIAPDVKVCVDFEEN